jgi:hypothetical protein
MALQSPSIHGYFASIPVRSATLAMKARPGIQTVRPSAAVSLGRCSCLGAKLTARKADQREAA